MLLDGKKHVIGINAAPVIGNADIGLAAVVDLDRYGACARVNRVFREFLDNGHRAGDHFARSNSARDRRIQYLNPVHRATPPQRY
ncbi:hypothetical protein SDC9_171398 [bioreactor metagenome]|uniref:Uncharacterized protein n=1 Tax=bioreactor metagenome TaxID=1076179 RepID=A0A645GBJ0_9ZZZZ